MIAPPCSWVIARTVYLTSLQERRRWPWTDDTFRAMATRAFLLLPLLAACGTSTPAATHAPDPDPVSAHAADPAASSTSDATFHSDALGVDKHYLVYLPAGYDADPARRWPVIYMLNGLGGDETNWKEQGKLPAVADSIGLQAIVVMADGDAGFYANSVTPVDYDKCTKTRAPFNPSEAADHYCVKTPNYEDYIVKDLIGHVDRTYRTIADRRGRAIGGLSMGGFGALELAMRHTDLFVSVASHSGVDALLYAGPHPYAPGKAVIADDVSKWGAEVEPIGAWVRAIFGKDLANWKAHDPATLAQNLEDGDLAIYLDCGTEDDFVLEDGASYLHDLLTARGVTHTFFLGPGHHDFDFWADRIDDSLRFHAAQFARYASGSPSQ
jgi:S-formylglutathione hydrolase FrmB